MIESIIFGAIGVLIILALLRLIAWAWTMPRRRVQRQLEEQMRRSMEKAMQAADEASTAADAARKAAGGAAIKAGALADGAINLREYGIVYGSSLTDEATR